MLKQPARNAGIVITAMPEFGGVCLRPYGSPRYRAITGHANGNEEVASAGLNLQAHLSGRL